MNFFGVKKKPTELQTSNETTVEQPKKSFFGFGKKTVKNDSKSKMKEYQTFKELQNDVKESIHLHEKLEKHQNNIKILDKEINELKENKTVLEKNKEEVTHSLSRIERLQMVALKRQQELNSKENN